MSGPDGSAELPEKIAKCLKKLDICAGKGKENNYEVYNIR